MTKISLPIDFHIEEIHKKIKTGLPLVLKASPGSGKTTRVPAYVLKNKMNSSCIKKIIVLVPKRISALSAAYRVCEENNWTIGNEVGYAVRFDSKVSLNTKLIFMTDGLFLKKMNNPEFIKSISTLFLDEFHERKINQDLILGLLTEHNIVGPAIQITIMSATIDSKQLSQYFSDFGGSHEIVIYSKIHSIEEIYLKRNQKIVIDQTFFEQICETLTLAFKKSSLDILIFLPGFKEILRTQEKIKPVFPNIEIVLLHGSLSINDQKKIIQKMHSNRRIILATNIAESSLTLPDLDCVIDTGLEKFNVFEKKIGFNSLNTRRISKFSAAQRAGRAGRIKNGFVYKLWHPSDELSMPNEIEPEIVYSPLEDTLLHLASWNVYKFTQFSWLTKPQTENLQKAAKKLTDWQMLKNDNSSFKLTDFGNWILQSPVNIGSTLILFELYKMNTFPKNLYVFIAQLENIDQGSQIEHLGNESTDIDRIFYKPVSETTKKLVESLKHFMQDSANQHQFFNSSVSKNKNPELELFQIFAKYFPEKIIAKKNKTQGLSALGRGVEISSHSRATNDDFIAALSGYEKNDSITIVTHAVGISKSQALEIFSGFAINKIQIEFDQIRKMFFKKESLDFMQFKLNEKAKVELTAKELELRWKKFVLENPKTFLELNSDFSKIKDRLFFLKKHRLQLSLVEEEFYFINNFETQIIDKMLDLFDKFEDFLNAQIIYLLENIVPAQTLQFLKQMPASIQLPTGKIVMVDYLDPKAPMISAKIQDCFGWKKHPSIIENKIKLTLQLLAPNMRPTQITDNLELFWQNSYHDVKKDLKARYPKHSWPDHPEKL